MARYRPPASVAVLLGVEALLLGLVAYAAVLAMAGGRIAAAEPAEKVVTSPTTADSASKGPMIAHMVFFTLKESNDENRKKLVDAAKEYLGGHPGEVYFSVGEMVDLKEKVGVTDFDVALHIVFENRAAHDEYLVSARHKKFVAVAHELDKSTRVFDSALVPLDESAAK